jgi:hypothetical protein
VAVVRNITSDVLTLFSTDAPPAQPGDEIPVSDERFVDRAWPKSTWELVKKPAKDYVDASTDDAYLFVTQPDETVDELRERAAAAGVDLTGLTKKADIVAAIAAGPTNDSEESA